MDRKGKFEEIEECEIEVHQHGLSDDTSTNPLSDETSSAVVINTENVSAKKRNSVNETVNVADLCETLSDYFEDLNDLDKSFTVSVHMPIKSGEGISSFYVYQIDIQTSIFENETPNTNRMSVQRRFSDFIMLHEKFVQKYLHQGRIVPPPPQKDPVGTALLMFQTRDKVSSDEFLNKRRLALRRFLIRVNRHPILRIDEDFKHFLNTTSSYQSNPINPLISSSSQNTDRRISHSPTAHAGSSEKASITYESTDTSIQTGSNPIRKVLNVIQSGVNKVVHKIDEPDMFFDELQQNVDATLSWLRKLSRSFENIALYRKKTALSLEMLKKSVQVISNCEQSSMTCRSLSHLSQGLGKVFRTYQLQSEVELFVLAETIEDYVSLYLVIKQVLEYRMQILMSWRAAEDVLKEKRNSKLRWELSGDKDRIPQAELDIIECEVKVDRYKENFDNISSVIRSEMSRFNLYKVHDIREASVAYTKSLHKFYTNLNIHWKDLLVKISDP